MQHHSMVTIVVLGLLMSGCAAQYQFASYTPPSPSPTYFEPEEEAPPPRVRAKPRQTASKPQVTHVSSASSAGAAEPLAPLLPQRPASSPDITTGSSVATEPGTEPAPASAIALGKAKQLRAERESDEEFQRQLEHDRRVTSGLCRC